jgi:hypothetical protein
MRKRRKRLTLASITIAVSIYVFADTDLRHMAFDLVNAVFSIRASIK